MNIIYQRVLLSILFLTPFYTYSQAEEPVKTKAQYKKLFKQSYGEYKKAVAQDDAKITLQYAKESYEFGCKAYGESNINCAKLGVNYLSHVRYSDKQSPAVAKVILPVYEKKYGAKSLDVIEVMILSASKYPHKENRQAIAVINTALDYLKPLAIDSYLRANVELNAGKALLNLDPNKAEVLQTSYDNLSEVFHADDARLLDHRFWAAKYLMRLNKKSDAIDLFEKNVSIYETITDFTHPYELVARAHLVTLYERSRKSSEATKHCIAIGEIRPWNDNQEQVPLFRIAPKYPMQAARSEKEGWTQLSFTIDESGMVREPKILKSSSRTFNKTSLNALKQWRYAPKFENGKAVRVTDLTVQLDYKMGEG